MVCSASSTGDEITRAFSTKAWYAAFLLSKNVAVSPKVSQAALLVFRQKPGIQLFFFRKTSS